MDIPPSILAAQNIPVKVLKKMWAWFEDTPLNPEEMKKELFLSKHKYGRIAWNQAAIKGNLEASDTLRCWGKEAEQNTDELLLVQTGDVYMAFQLAAESNHVETLKKLWVWAEETQLLPKRVDKEIVSIQRQLSIHCVTPSNSRR